MKRRSMLLATAVAAGLAAATLGFSATAQAQPYYGGGWGYMGPGMMGGYGPGDAPGWRHGYGPGYGPGYRWHHRGYYRRGYGPGFMGGYGCRGWR